MLAHSNWISIRKLATTAIMEFGLVAFMYAPGSAAQTHITVSVSPTSASVEAGTGKQQFTATVRSDRSANYLHGPGNRAGQSHGDTHSNLGLEQHQISQCNDHGNINIARVGHHLAYQRLIERFDRTAIYRHGGQ